MNWLHYLLQVNLYLLLFYGFYRLWLRNETFHQLNRVYLVASATLSFFIPTLQSDWVKSWFVTQQLSETIYTYYNPQAIVVLAIEPTQPQFTWGNLAAVLYLSGILFFIGKFAYRLAHLERFLRRRKRADNQQPFAFFNVLSVGKNIPGRDTILAHERTHVRQLHSADLLLFEMITIFNWFNPVVFAYQQSIRNIHEFLADENAARQAGSLADYATLLFSQSLGVKTLPLANYFFDPLTLKRRIKMLVKPKSSHRAVWKYGLTLPLLILMLIFSSSAISESRVMERIENAVTLSKSVFEGSINVSKALVMSPKLAEAMKDANITISGKVMVEVKGKTGIKNVPIPGANVIIKGTYKGTFTDGDGKYVFGDVPIEKRNDLIVSFVGFRLKNTVQHDNEIDFIMEEESHKLSDVVIVGYARDENKPQSLFPAALEKPIQRADGVFMAVEQQPEFPGGPNEMYRFLANNVLYPRKAQNANAQGKVFVEFIVKSNGEIGEISVQKGIGFGCDEEAVRVVATMPRWNPGKQNGVPVAVQYTLPITFILEPLKPVVSDDNDEIFTVVEHVPEFRGGVKALMKFIQENIKFPEAAKQNKVEGRVLVNFVVKKDGKVSNAEIVKSLGFGCDEEVLRMMKLMPDWIPGSQNDKPVNVRFTLPVEFKNK